MLDTVQTLLTNILQLDLVAYTGALIGAAIAVLSRKAFASLAKK